MNSPVIPVVVVVAGPTRITAATLLARYGVPSVVPERLLRANLRRHPGVELRGNTEVTGLEPGGPDRVLVHTEDRRPD